MVGVSSGLVALLPHIDVTVAKSLLILVACVSLSLAYAWRESKRPHLPLEEIEAIPRCRLQCPADRSLAEQSHDLAAESYGRIEPINSERYEQWRLKNPNVLVCLVDEDENVIGYFDVFPITTEFAEALTGGIATEYQMLHEHIVGPNHIAECKWLYLGGIAVKDPETFLGRRRAAYLVWGLKMYLRDFYQGPPNRTLIATGASKEGEHLLQRFHFTLRQSKNRRADKQNLYAVSITNRTFLAALDDIPNWRAVCRIGWRASKMKRSKGG